MLGEISIDRVRSETIDLVANTVDIIASSEDTSAVVEYAESEAGVYSFAHHSPMQHLGQTSTTSGHLLHWEVLFEWMVQKVYLGKYTNQNLVDVDLVGFIQDGSVEVGGIYGVQINTAFIADLQAKAVDFVPYCTIIVYDLIQNLVETMDDSSSPFNPFDGPLYDQDGTLLVENGESMSFEELLSIYWLLGVEGGCEATNDDECVVGSLL